MVVVDANEVPFATVIGHELFASGAPEPGRTISAAAMVQGELLLFGLRVDGRIAEGRFGSGNADDPTSHFLFFGASDCSGPTYAEDRPRFKGDVWLLIDDSVLNADAIYLGDRPSVNLEPAYQWNGVSCQAVGNRSAVPLTSLGYFSTLHPPPYRIVADGGGVSSIHPTSVPAVGPVGLFVLASMLAVGTLVAMKRGH